MVNVYRSLLMGVSPLPDPRTWEEWQNIPLSLLTDTGIPRKILDYVLYSYRKNQDCNPAVWMVRYVHVSAPDRGGRSSLNSIETGGNNYLQLCRTESLDYAERVRELCSLFDIELASDDFLSLHTLFFLLSLNGGLIDQFKYAVNLAFCEHYRLELPDKEPQFLGTYLFPRALRVYIGRIKSSGKYLLEKNQELIYTLFQGLKKGLLPVRPEKVLSTLSLHAATLSQQNVTPDDCLGVVDRVCDSIEYNPDQMYFDMDHVVSSKSTIEYNFEKKGALGALLRIYYDHDDTVKAIDSGVPRFVGFVRRDLDVEAIYGFGPTMKELWADCGFEAIRKSLFETPKSQPYCILEPMKVRTITKPKWNQYLGLKRFQKGLWKSLVRHQSGSFDLIGEPLQRTHLHKIVNSWRPGYGFCSGDYSAATDNLHMDVTMRICKNMFGRTIHPEDYQTCVNALTGGKIVYPLGKILPGGDEGSYWEKIQKFFQNGSKSGRTNSDLLEELGLKDIPDIIDQTNGQLMGSVISFVILCIANYAAYHYAWETFLNRKISPFDFEIMQPVLINGDDILFSSSEEFYWHWRSVIGKFGFKPSVGKNLFSKDILQINSELYHVLRYHSFETGKTISVPRKISYANFGLITNRRKQDCEIDTSVSSLGLRDVLDWFEDTLQGRFRVLKKIQDTLLDGLTPRMQSLVNKLFWKHSSYLKENFPNIDFFVGEDEGGLGLSAIGLGRMKLVRDTSFQKACRARGKRVIDLLFKDSLPRIFSNSREFCGSEFPVSQGFTSDYCPFEQYDMIRKTFRSQTDKWANGHKEHIESAREWVSQREFRLIW